ncbi:MAG: sulfite exporter TauE/SafE family protein [Clostridia bacterium]|nr:sulfite exporter TauE/SafE family protein [Clostridia bacterium]
MNFLNIIAGFFSGVAGAMGLGGGGVLVLYLTLIKDFDQIKSQGINLLFFIPCAVIAIIIHSKRKLIKWKKILPFIIGGVLGVTIGVFLINHLDTSLISKLFAGLLILMGLREFFVNDSKNNQDKTAK